MIPFFLFASAESLAPREVVTAHLGEAKDCYVNRVKEGLDKDGKLIISWRIDPAGQATQFKSRLNELGDEKLYTCLVDKIKTWKFTPSDQSQIQNFLFPFVFKRK